MQSSSFSSRVVAALSLALFAWSYFHPGTSNITKPLLEHHNAPAAALSVIALDHLKKKGASLQPFSSSHLALEEDGALAVPSDEELEHFPGATVVEAEAVEGPEAGQYTRIKILKTDFKTPMIRSEEVIDQQTGETLAHEEMAADHFLANLPPGATPESFLRSLGPHAIGLEPVTSDGLYIVYLDSYKITALSRELQNVDGAEPDFIHPSTDRAGNPNVSWHWALDKILGTVGHLFAFQEKKSSKPPLIVAVIDSGIRYTHQELTKTIWHNPAPQQRDFYGTNAVSKTGDPMDDNGHGTFCAGIIGAAGHNPCGFTGVTSNIRLMACKVLDQNGVGQISDEIKGIEYACAKGASILNCSFGGPGYSQALYEAFDKARRQGIICVVSAGNEGRKNSPSYPASFGCDDPEPAYRKQPKLDNVIAVAASTEKDDLASFSNYGNPFVPIAAPGVDICSTFNTSDTSYASGSGTSFAAPYVTGALAVLATQFPNASYTQLIDRLFQTVDRPARLAGKVTFGRLNIAKALWQ